MFVCHVSLSRNCSTKIYVVMGYAAFCFLVSIYPLTPVLAVFCITTTYNQWGQAPEKTVLDEGLLIRILLQ